MSKQVLTNLEIIEKDPGGSNPICTLRSRPCVQPVLLLPQVLPLAGVL
jgi:hypothetical protein